MAFLTPNIDNPLSGERNPANKNILSAYLLFFVGMPFLFLELFLLSHFASSIFPIPNLLYSPHLLSVIHRMGVFWILFFGFICYSFIAYHLTKDHFPYNNKVATGILAWSGLNLGLIVISGGIVHIVNSMFIFALSHFVLGVGYFSYVFVRKKSPFTGLFVFIFFLAGLTMLIDALSVAQPIQWPIIGVYMVVSTIITIRKMGSQALEYDKDLYYRYTGRRTKENTD